MEEALIKERIRATFMEWYFCKDHNLQIDNLYTSLILAIYLVDNDTNVTGIIRETAKFPLKLNNTILQKGVVVF